MSNASGKDLTLQEQSEIAARMGAIAVSEAVAERGESDGN
jgi:hypothetical protein